MNGDLSWEHVSLSDPVAVRGLLKFRSEFDPTFDIDERGIMESAMDLAYVDENIHLTYIDLQQVMDKTALTDHQKKVLGYYQQGYDMEAIADIMRVEEVLSIDITIDGACKSISDKNKEGWVEDFAKWNHVRVYTNYKECIRCGEFLPETSEYFAKDSRIIGGLRNYCRKCD